MKVQQVRSGCPDLTTVRPIRRTQRARSQADTGVWLRDYGQPLKSLNTGDGPSVATLARRDWKTRGSCVGDQTGLWFSEPGTLKSLRAASICRSCPVRQLCLAAALAFDEEFGIWGGLTPPDRRPLVASLELGETLSAVLAAVDTVTMKGVA